MSSIHRLRDGSAIRDKAILDALHLRELKLVNGSIVPRQMLEQLWYVSQPQVSRRMRAVKDVGMFHVDVVHGGFVLREFKATRA